MRRLTSFTALLTGALLLTACGGRAGPETGQPGAADCRVEVSGDITVPTVFENGPEACDYFFPGGDTANYRLSSEVLIEAGTTLRFGQNALLYVIADGSITATGTAAARITLEGEQPLDGYWHGICFEQNRESHLEFVDVRNAGKRWTVSGTACKGGIAGSYPGGEPVHISNSTVSGSYVSGLSAHYLNLGQFADNAFYGNREYGVVIEAKQVRKLDPASDYLGERSGAVNGQPFVYAGGHISDPGVDHVWHNLNAPYFTTYDTYDYGRNISVDNGTTLVLSPGTTLVFDGDSELSVSGGSSLGMAGTLAEPVTLRGLHEERGSWNGVRINHSAALLQHVNVLWGGRSDVFYTGSLYFGEIGTDPNGKILDHVFIDGSANCALVIEHEDQSVFERLDVNFGDNNELNEC